MSVRRFGRGYGIGICCDGFGIEDCTNTVSTANIVTKVNRQHAAGLGWGRGLDPGSRRVDGTGRPSTRRHDVCPIHLAMEVEAKAKRTQKRKDQMAARAAARLARAEAAAARTDTK